MATAADLTCSEQLSLKNIDLGYTSMFDDERGFVYLTAGNACWNEITNGIAAAGEFVKEQIAMLMTPEQQDFLARLAGGDPEDAQMKLDQAEQLIAAIDQYTDGELMVSGWTWPAEAVMPGEEAGACFTQSGRSSCWVWTMGEDGSYSEMVQSYMLDPTTITEESGMISLTNTDISNPVTPGVFGSWLCMPPEEMEEGWMSSICMRLIPSPEYEFVADDPSFVPGEIEVSSYLSSRLTRPLADNSPQPLNGNLMLQAQSKAFDSFQIDLSETFGMDASLSGLASGLAALTVAIAALAF